MRLFLSRKVSPKRRLLSFYYTLFFYGRAFLILAACLWAGKLISYLIPITIPGSIIGLLILFFLMVFQLIPTKWVKGGCNILIRNMTLLFIPAAMGIMDNYILLMDNWIPILVGSIGSTLIVLICMAFLTEYIENREKVKAEKANSGEN